MLPRGMVVNAWLSELGVWSFSLITALCSSNTVKKGYFYWHTVVTLVGMILQRPVCMALHWPPQASFQPYLTMMIQLYQTSSSASTSNYTAVSKVLIWKFDIKKKSLMEDKRKYTVQGVYTRQNPKRQISPVSLLL